MFYILQVTVTDSEGLEHSLNLTVNIVDVNYSPSFIGVTHLGDLPEDTTSSAQIAQVQAADADGDDLTFSITAAVPLAAPFVIDPTTGKYVIIGDKINTV